MPSLDADLPLTPSRTRALLEQLGHLPRKPLGQNFLIDGNIVRKSLAMAQIGAGDTVVEVGPGLGTLTRALLAAGCEVHAVELDTRLAAHLRDTLGENAPEPVPTFHLKEGDAVDFPLGHLTLQPEQDYKIVANLPYAITSPWLDEVMQQPGRPSRLVLMMQKEAADRLTAPCGHKHYSAITIFLQSAYREFGRHAVSRQCFYPVPGVDSVLLGLERLPEPRYFTEAARHAIRQIFTQRRKQIGALVRGEAALEAWLATAAASHGVKSTDRPEVIPLPAWQLLAELA
ncbi:MAG: 16S rRNA (adenine(1518)-N(6)/adenine(1519)-N(6))-dimethyltransferase RsmA [Verrucomicrobiota bacterium JB022]|nr:16S rRNA (adenine(1518)-N(6)/adenine(1519)-N(6))-dimethyltransferase RsmA [Verrucomicrobiota bacterium JB022]